MGTKRIPILSQNFPLPFILHYKPYFTRRVHNYTIEMITQIHAFTLLILNDIVAAQGPRATNFLNPGEPTKEEEGKYDDISGFKRFLHKLGVDLDPSDVVVGLIILALIGGAVLYFMKMQKEDPKEKEEDL